MSMNNNSAQPPKNVIGYPTHFVPPGPPPPQLIHHHHHHQAGPSHFPGHFQLSEPQVQALAQSQYSTAQAQIAQAQMAQAQMAQAQIAQAQMGQAQMAAPSPPPSAGSGMKRANPRPNSRPPAASNANAGSPFKTMEITPAARRKKQKSSESEKMIPEKIASLLPESALYTQLLEYEARIDAVLARKKMDIQESLKGTPRFQRTLRIYVFNTFSNQSETVGSDNPATWSLRIIGRLLEDDKKEPRAAGIKFSCFFKKVTIYLDQKLYPENHVIAWEGSRSTIFNDGFEVKRKGNKEFTAAIRLEMNYCPEKYKLSQPLSEALGGIEADTRLRVSAAIWQYVKAKRLQVSGDPTSFFCDPALKRVFGEDRIRFASVPTRLTQHLLPPPPIHIEHLVKLSGDSPAGTSCYDVLVDLPLRLEKEMRSFMTKTEENKKIDSYDELISASIKMIHEHRRRRAFFLGFSQSPAEFINTLVASQSKDLKLVAGDSARDSEKERRSDFYNQPWVDDAVIRYLNRKSTGTADAPGSI